MAGSGQLSHWISLIFRRFGRESNLSGDYKAVEQSAIPTVTMIAEWARDDQPEISEMWLFGSALDHDSWDSLKDDIDILFIVPDKLWKPDMERTIPKEAPLSDHYLPIDIRVRRESDCEPWRTQALMKSKAAPVEDGHKMTVVEYAMRTGICVWRRSDDEKRQRDEDSAE